MAVRFTDVDPEAIERFVAGLAEQLTLYPEISDPRNFEPFVGRGRARFALGAPIADVLNDLRCAGICLRGQARVRLYKLDKSRLKSRRLEPMHLGLLHADAKAAEATGRDYGLPLMTVYAGAADPDLEAEVLPMSGYFRRRALSGPSDIVGLAAASYASALGSLMRGDDAEARGVLRILGAAADTLTGEPPGAGKRYLLQCAALAALLGRRQDELSDHLVALVPWSLAEREAAAKADPDGVRLRGEGAPDPTIPALFGLASIMNVSVDPARVSSADEHLGALCAAVKRGWDAVE